MFSPSNAKWVLSCETMCVVFKVKYFRLGLKGDVGELGGSSPPTED